MISNSVIKAPLTIKAQAGDTFTRQFSIKKNDVAFDLSTYSLKLSVKNTESTIILEWLNAAFELISTGVYKITKTATEMNVAAGVYSYELQITYPTSEQRTWLYGQFIIEQQTT